MEKNTKSSHYTSSWEHLKTSVALVRQNPEPVIITVLLPSLVTRLGSVLVQQHASAGSAIALLGGIWMLLSMPAVLLVQLHIARGKTITATEAYTSGFAYFWRVLGVTILTAVLILLGTVAFIVPGLMLFRRWCLASYYVVDKNMGIRDAMRQSWEDTNKAAGYVWGTIGMAILVSIGSSLVGILFNAIPGGAAVVTSILSLAGFFLLPLRYKEIGRSIRSTAASSDS